jgi:hypothetical protein
MRFYRSLSTLMALFVLALATASPIRATVPVHPVSGYGADYPGFSECLHPDPTDSFNFGNPCEDFLGNGITPAPTVVTLSGQNYDVLQFVYGDGTHTGTVLDVVDLGSIGAGTNFALPSLFGPAQTEIFSCLSLGDSFDDNQNIFASNEALNGPCTPIPDGTNSTVNVSTDGKSFITGAGFNVTDLVLDVTAPPIGTPEPGSFLLLSAGILGLLSVKLLRS